MPVPEEALIAVLEHARRHHIAARLLLLGHVVRRRARARHHPRRVVRADLHGHAQQRRARVEREGREARRLGREEHDVVLPRGVSGAPRMQREGRT
jgi:hypothetical protein